MSWIRPKRTDVPAQPPSVAPAPRAPNVGIPEDDDDLPIEVTGVSTAAPSAAASPRAAAGGGAQTSASGLDARTTLTDDTTIVGSITTASDLWIAGRLEGNVDSGAAVHVSADGVVVGNVTARRIRVERGGAIEGALKTSEAMISGTVRGPVAASGRLEITSSGEVVGDVTAQNLHVDDGATLQGRCTMSRGR
jgi:cytoskeletal protein CcmA (bactofilin family)